MHFSLYGDSILLYKIPLLPFRNGALVQKTFQLWDACLVAIVFRGSNNQPLCFRCGQRVVGEAVYILLHRRDRLFKLLFFAGLTIEPTLCRGLIVHQTVVPPAQCGFKTDRLSIRCLPLRFGLTVGQLLRDVLIRDGMVRATLEHRGQSGDQQEHTEEKSHDDEKLLQFAF